MKKIFYFTTILFIVLSSCEKDDETKSTILPNLDRFSISSLAFDGSNQLWVATDTGLFKLLTSGYELFDIGVDVQVTAVTFDQSINSLWIGTTGGIYQIKLGDADSTVVSIALDQLSNTTILSVYVDENSEKWFGTGRGVTRNANNKWQKDKFKMNISGALVNMPFYEYAVTSIGIWEGNYFFATAGNKLWRTVDWQPSVDAFTGATMWDQPYNGFAIADTMYAVFIDSKGQQWFGGKEGVQVHIGHDPESDNTPYFDELVNPIVHCIAEDTNGNIWVGTENGISIFDGENWTASTATLPNKYITAISFHGNKAWVGTKQGLTEIAY